MMKRLVAVFLLCVYCAMPVLGMAAPYFETNIRVSDYESRACKCGSGNKWHKVRAPYKLNLQGNNGYVKHDNNYHKIQWAQTYKCPRECQAGTTRTKWEYGLHTRSYQVGYPTYKFNPDYTITTYHCNTCNCNFTVTQTGLH